MRFLRLFAAVLTTTCAFFGFSLQCYCRIDDDVRFDVSFRAHSRKTRESLLESTQLHFAASTQVLLSGSATPTRATPAYATPVPTRRLPTRRLPACLPCHHILSSHVFARDKRAALLVPRCRRLAACLRDALRLHTTPGSSSLPPCAALRLCAFTGFPSRRATHCVPFQPSHPCTLSPRSHTYTPQNRGFPNATTKVCARPRRSTTHLCTASCPSCPCLHLRPCLGLGVRFRVRVRVRVRVGVSALPEHLVVRVRVRARVGVSARVRVRARFRVSALCPSSLLPPLHASMHFVTKHLTGRCKDHNMRCLSTSR